MSGTTSGNAMAFRLFAIAAAIAVVLASNDWSGSAAGALKKHYWATSLSGPVDPLLLQGLRAAVEHGETGWLDIDPRARLPLEAPGINLVLYHVGGNCYIGADCMRFPSTETTGTRWDNDERAIDLYEPVVRMIVIADLMAMLQQADRVMPPRSIIGVHVDNVHKLDDRGIAALFNDYLAAVDLAKRHGAISADRVIGYIAKNNPQAFKRALDRGLLDTRPLYQIIENASLDEHGALDDISQRAQALARQFGVPVFLKTFGSDIAYKAVRGGRVANVYVSQEMTARMARLPYIAGAAWSANEADYHPTFFAQGSPVIDIPLRLARRL
jgi:hypothetical protein